MYELGIDYEEVLRYLGIKEPSMNLEIQQEIEETVTQLKSGVDYKIEYKVCSISEEAGGVSVGDTSLHLEGQEIKKLLQDCNQCILLAVTLGQGVDAMLRRLQVRELSRAVMVDFCASSMVEHLCNQLEDTLREEWEKRGLYLTDRFSPGYGDLPLEVQKTFCEVLDTSKKIGLHVTSSGLMVPSKSITAIIGIADRKQKMRIKGCQFCQLFEECEYRKGGKSCDERII